jgi:hypothetical protein
VNEIPNCPNVVACFLRERERFTHEAATALAQGGAELLAGDALERMWQKVNLDWRIITRIETLMDYKLGPQERIMTMDVINWTLEQL